MYHIICCINYVLCIKIRFAVSKWFLNRLKPNQYHSHEEIRQFERVSLRYILFCIVKMSFERYINDFGSFESALLDYGVENIPNILVMNDESIVRDRLTRIFVTIDFCTGINSIF